MATLEDLLEETGKFSRFQVLILALTLSPKILGGWSMLMMSFAGVVPDWWCVPSDDHDDVNNRDNTTFQICPQNETTQCDRVYSSSIRTVINEWDLVCEKAWIKPAVTSIQMAGVLVGALLGGQSADIIGRRYTTYLSVLIHGVANIVAAYSVSWQMFTVLRFVLGLMIGSLLVVTYTYSMEFIGVKERSICSSIPYWLVGVGLFALTAWRLEDWSQLHLVCGALHVIFLIGFFFVPESVRWLALQGRIEESEKVIYKMCSINRTKRPDRCREKLESLAQEEKKLRESRGKYTYIEIVRGWTMFKRTAMIDFVWCCLSVIYYGLSFGVDKLSGNVYLNIFLMSFIEIPGMMCIMYLTNRFGRRFTCAGLFTLGLVGALGVVITHYAFHVQDKSVIITVFALTVKFGAGVGWSAFQVFSSESYPTVIRNLGYGAANTAARVGGIISPFLFTAENDVSIPFIIITVLFVVCITVSLLLAETNGSPLQDTLMLPEMQVHGTPEALRKSKDPEKINIEMKETSTGSRESKIKLKETNMAATTDIHATKSEYSQNKGNNAQEDEDVAEFETIIETEEGKGNLSRQPIGEKISRQSQKSSASSLTIASSYKSTGRSLTDVTNDLDVELYSCHL